MAIPLTVKSPFSYGEGVAPVEALVERALALRLPALALTDVDTLAAQPLFHDLCQRRGIRAITGVELRPARGAPPGRVIAIARDWAGYRSLCKIVSRRRGGAGRAAEQQAARDPVAAVAAYPDGLFALSDDAQVLERLAASPALDRASLRGLLVRPSPEAAQATLLRAAAELGIGVAADGAARLADPEDAPLALLLDAIKRRIVVDEARLGAAIEAGARAPDRVDAALDGATTFAELPQAVDESRRLAAACTLELRRGTLLLPGAEAFGGRAPQAELAARCGAALAARRAGGSCRAERYADQLARELGVIDALGLAGYFLAAAEVAAAARELDIAIAPRGSAVASLVVHLLGISPIDPLAHGLIFERFLHARRLAPPDIDLDVCSRRRDELIRRCYARFGHARVALVGTHHRYRLQGALRDGLQTIGVAPAAVARVAAALTRDGEDPEAVDARLNVPGLRYPCRPESLRCVLRLIGMPRLLALHPGGTVIAPAALDELAPVERAARRFTVLQYDATAAAAVGLTKLDILGNRFLTQLGDTISEKGVRFIFGRGERTSTGTSSALAGIPLDDPATLAALDRADTIGCFQVETPAVRALLEQLPIRRIEDCVAVLALVRPGAAAGAVKREYVRRAHASDEVRAAEPAVEGVLEEPPAGLPEPPVAGVLEETFGLVLYDEDLMRMLSLAGGISLAEADRLRAALIDAGPDEQAALEAELKRHALARGGRAAGVDAAWRTAAKFAAYSFCKAHALSYALLAFRGVYLKQHYPIEFGCALLRSYGGAYPLRTIAADLMRRGVTIAPPAINLSAAETTLERDAGAASIRLGLLRVKHLTRRSCAAILAERERRGPFETVDDLLARVPLGRRELASLARSGTCDALAPLSREGFPDAHEALLRGLGVAAAARPTGGASARSARDASARSARHASARLARGTSATPARDPSARRANDAARLLVRIQNELELLGMHLAAHPMQVLRGEARRYGCLRSTEIERAAAGSPARFAGIVAASRRHRDASGSRTLFLTLEDEAGLLDVVVPPARFGELAAQVTTPGPYLVAGVTQRELGRVTLRAETLWPFHERARRLQAAS